MPVGTTDYRARLAGPGTQDVLGMILRGLAGGSAPSADPVLDAEGAAAVRQLGTPLRPDQQAAQADRLARDVHRRIIGAPPSKPSQPEETSWLERITGLPSVARQLAEHERTYAAATARGGGIAPAPSDMTVAQSGMNVAGNFDFTGSIKGLPAGVTVADRAFLQAIERGAVDMEATPRSGGRQGFNVKINARPTEGVRSYKTTRGHAQYDPKMADVETLDAGDILERQNTIPKSHVIHDIEKVDGDVIYRGMSAEEYEEFTKTGKIASKGDYNMGGQEGLTYWSTDPKQAQSYASGFAPWQHKPTFERPAYVVAVRKPQASDLRHVQGTGETEVGVARVISGDEVVAVWRGDVYDYRPGEFDLVPKEWSDTGDPTALKMGGGSAPSAQVAWSRQLRPDEQAAIADRKAREAHRQIIGADQPMYETAVRPAPAPQSGWDYFLHGPRKDPPPESALASNPDSMDRRRGIGEMMQATGMKVGVGRLSTNVERAKPTELEQVYLKIRRAAIDQGEQQVDIEDKLNTIADRAGSPAKALEAYRYIWKEEYREGRKVAPQSLMGGPGGEVRPDLPAVPIPASKPPSPEAMDAISPKMPGQRSSPLGELPPTSGRSYRERLTEQYPPLSMLRLLLGLSAGSGNVEDRRSRR